MLQDSSTNSNEQETENPIPSQSPQTISNSPNETKSDEKSVIDSQIITNTKQQSGIFKSGTFFLKTPKNLFIDFLQNPKVSTHLSQNEYLFVDVCISTSNSVVSPTTEDSQFAQKTISPAATPSSQTASLELRTFTGEPSQQFEFDENGIVSSVAFPNLVLTMIESTDKSKNAENFTISLKPLEKSIPVSSTMKNSTNQKEKQTSSEQEEKEKPAILGSLNQKFFVQEISGEKSCFIVNYKNGSYVSINSKNYEEWFSLGRVKNNKVKFELFIQEMLSHHETDEKDENNNKIAKKQNKTFVLERCNEGDLLITRKKPLVFDHLATNEDSEEEKIKKIRNLHIKKEKNLGKDDEFDVFNEFLQKLENSRIVKFELVPIEKKEKEKKRVSMLKRRSKSLYSRALSEINLKGNKIDQELEDYATWKKNIDEKSGKISPSGVISTTDSTVDSPDPPELGVNNQNRDLVSFYKNPKNMKFFNILTDIVKYTDMEKLFFNFSGNLGSEKLLYSEGVVMYLSNLLFELDLEDPDTFGEVEFFLPQLLNVMVLSFARASKKKMIKDTQHNKKQDNTTQSASPKPMERENLLCAILLKFLMNACSLSLHFVFRCCWHLEALEKPNGNASVVPMEYSFVCSEMRKWIFKQIQINPDVYYENTNELLNKKKKFEESLQQLFESSVPNSKNQKDLVQGYSMNEKIMENLQNRQKTVNYFNDELNFVFFFNDLSRRLKAFPGGAGQNNKVRKDRLRFYFHLFLFKIQKKQRNLQIQQRLELEFAFSHGIASKVYIPIFKSAQNHCSVMNIVVEESFPFSTKERVPYMVLFETLESPIATFSRPFQSKNKEQSTKFEPKTIVNKFIEANVPKKNNNTSNSDKYQERISPISTEQTKNEEIIIPEISIDAGSPMPNKTSHFSENIDVNSPSAERHCSKPKKNSSISIISDSMFEVGLIKPVFRRRTLSLQGIPSNLSSNETSDDIFPRFHQQNEKNSKIVISEERKQEHAFFSEDTLTNTNPQCETDISLSNSASEETVSSFSTCTQPLIDNDTSNTPEKLQNLAEKEDSSSIVYQDGDSDADFVVLDKEEVIKMRKTERIQLMDFVFGEEWYNSKSKRIQSNSAFGSLENWKLEAAICKANDLLVSEHLAWQLLTIFQKIFEESKLPLFLYPYQIVVTGNDCGFLEVIKNSQTISNVKKKCGEYFSKPQNMKECFDALFGGPATTTTATTRAVSPQQHASQNLSEYRKAQRNYVESLAAYSIACYVLQIKDRHTGNIMLTRDGHIVHIDFGFYLSAHPGIILFEVSPFKLTSDDVEIMGGKNSDLFQYFKTLVILGLKACAKESNRQRIQNVIKFQLPGFGFPCFANSSGQGILKDLESRLFPNLSEERFETQAKNLINNSLDAWTTQQYDNFQRLTNGYL